jgi:hypothetical protein
MKSISKYSYVALMAAITLTGCSIAKSSETAFVPDKLNCNFSVDINITTEDTSSIAHLVRNDSSWTASFTEPSALSGIDMLFEDDEITASYKGLSFSVPQSAVPVQSALSNFILAAENIQTEDSTYNCVVDGSDYKLCGSIDNGDFTLIFDESGLPVSFEMENFNLLILFENYSDNASDIQDIQIDETTETDETFTETITDESTS